MISGQPGQSKLIIVFRIIKQPTNGGRNINAGYFISFELVGQHMALLNGCEVIFNKDDSISSQPARAAPSRREVCIVSEHLISHDHSQSRRDLFEKFQQFTRIQA
jgi:hypothetical protein